MTVDEFKLKFKVGDRIRSTAWRSYVWIDILSIGDRCVFGRDEDGLEEIWHIISNNWELYKYPPRDISLVGRKFKVAFERKNIATEGGFYSEDIITILKEIK